MAHKIFFEEGDEVGIYKIIKCTGVKLLENHKKKKAKDVHFIVECKKCGNQREMQQKSLRYHESKMAYVCYACPLEIRQKAKKQRRKEYDKLRRLEDCLDKETAKLYRLALFKGLA